MSLSRYVGLPFVAGGRTLAGVDCWGLVRLYLMNEHGINGLPVYSEAPAHDVIATTRAVNAAMYLPTWQQVAKAEREAGDVAVLWCWDRTDKGAIIKSLRHVGVFADREHLLHIEQITDSVLVPWQSIHGRVHSIWRHQEPLPDSEDGQ